MANNVSAVKQYYRTKESRLGYKVLLKGVRHFGYYPDNQKISHHQAQIYMMEQVASSLNLPSGSKVLDAGCGEGATSIYFAKSFGHDVTGIDLLDESIAIAKSKTKGLKLPIRFLTGDFTKLPFADNTFDGLYAIETFIHSSDPKASLTEFRRVLKPGGRLVIADYTWATKDSLPSKYQKVLEWTANSVAVPGVLFIKPGWYESSLKKLNYKKVQLRNITTYVMPMIIWFWRISFIPYQLVRFMRWQPRYINTTMGYYGKVFARKGWWQFVIVSAKK